MRRRHHSAFAATLVLATALPVLLGGCATRTQARAGAAPPTTTTPVPTAPDAATTATGSTPPPRPAPVAPETAERDGASGHDPRLHAAPQRASALPSPVVVPLDAAVLAQLPREPVSATIHGVVLRCEGIALTTLLQVADAMPDAPLSGAQLGRYVQIDARDGYRVVFSLAELDPTLGDAKVYLADRCGGAALSADDGPLRLIVPNDRRGARSMRQLRSITVILAP